MIDNKKFWKNVKPYLSDQSAKTDKIHFNENREHIKIFFQNNNAALEKDIAHNTVF